MRGDRQIDIPLGGTLFSQFLTPAVECSLGYTLHPQLHLDQKSGLLYISDYCLSNLMKMIFPAQ